jgi:hypothetical protein
VFNQLDSALSDPKFNRHYHADFIELLALAENESGIEFDRVKQIYGGDQDLTNDLIELISSRIAAYDDKYPFSMNGRSRLTLKANITDCQKLYIFMLLCSNTSKIENASDFRRDFELISYKAMVDFLPSHSNCYIMGKSGIGGQRYTGHIEKKLALLAADLSSKIIYDEDAFAGNNSGDGGVDIVAWVPFLGDGNLKYMPLYAAQCATGRDWKHKQDEAANLKHYIETPKSFNVCLFIPYDGRNTDGGHNEKGSIRVPILFDRLRIINMFTDYQFINTIPSICSHVEQAIDYQEDII